MWIVRIEIVEDEEVEFGRDGRKLLMTIVAFGHCESKSSQRFDFTGNHVRVHGSTAGSLPAIFATGLCAMMRATSPAGGKDYRLAHV